MPKLRSPRKDYSILPLHSRLDIDPSLAGKGITIAFIDSGFHPHPDLLLPVKRIVRMIDVTDEKFEKEDFEIVRTSSWHGTMVASVACGSGHTSGGYYRGIASEASVVLIKVHDGKSVRPKHIVKALQWTIRNHKKYDIRIVNISVGGDLSDPKSSERLCLLTEELNSLGISIVAAAGNDPNKSIAAPASCRGVIAVGGVDDHNTKDETKLSEYGTSHGITVDGSVKPDLVAPANLLPAPMLTDNKIFAESEILFELCRSPMRDLKSVLKKLIKNTRLDPTLLEQSPRLIRKAIRERMSKEKFFAPGYQHVDGTSFAAPIVSSVVAQMLEADPDLGPEVVRYILTSSARKIPQISDDLQGHGLVSPAASVRRAKDEITIRSTQHTPKFVMDRIVFVYRDALAREVFLAGNFTRWTEQKIAMTKLYDSEWRAEIQLPAGNYEYKFIVDGGRWVEDPLNPHRTNNSLGGANSQLIIP